MKPIKKLTIELLEDRGFKKLRINKVSKNSISGKLIVI